MREVVTEVAASTANIELPLWEAAMVDGPGVGKMSTRTMEDENTLACRSWPKVTTCWWFCPCLFASYSA